MSESNSKPISKDSIIEQLKSRAQFLLQQLEGYNAINEEFKTVSRAIKVLSGEQVGPGRPEGGARAAVAGYVSPAKKRVLQLVKDGFVSAKQMAKHTRMHEHNFQQNGRELVRMRYLREGQKERDGNHYSKTYQLTEAGDQLLGESGDLPPLAVSTRPSGNHRAAKGDITAATMLPVLAQYPHGLNTTDLVEKMGHAPDRLIKNKVSIMVCYWRNKKILVTNKKDGTHTLTAAGKQKVAEILAE